MLAVRPVNPPRPSSSSLSPSRSAWSRRGVVPFRKWTKDSMDDSRIYASLAVQKTESDITFPFIRPQGCLDIRAVSVNSVVVVVRQVEGFGDVGDQDGPGGAGFRR